MLTTGNEIVQRDRAAKTRRITLTATLMSLFARELREMVRWMAVPKPHPTRKDEMAAIVKGRLTPPTIREYWDDLNAIEKMAVREVLYGDGLGIDWDQFLAKHGALPAAVVRSKKSSPYPLRCLLYQPKTLDGREDIIIPAELAQHLLEFVPPPPEPEIEVIDELPPQITRERYHYGPEGRTLKVLQCSFFQRDMERVACLELSTMLHLVDLGRLSVSATTRRPSSATLQHVMDGLHGGDFFEVSEPKSDPEQDVGPMRAFAWPWLLQVGKLATLRGSKLALTKAGHAAIGAPPAKTLRRLWQYWVKNTMLDEFSRIDVIKGQTRGKGRRSLVSSARRRPIIESALAQCPVGSWVEFAEFSRFMQASGMTFEVSRDPWRLYIADPHYGSLGHHGYHGWEILQERYVLCLLFEYAATLGLIDVAYTHPAGARDDFRHMWGADELEFLSLYDGLEYFRLTPLGAYCLGVTEDYQPTFSTPRTPVTVLPSGLVRARTELTAEERHMLETFADAESDGVWRLAREKILLAIEGGHRVEDLRDFLAARDEQPLPELVEGFLQSVQHSAHALKPMGMAMLIECVDETVALRLVEDKRTSKLCMRSGKKHIVVPNKAAAAFRKAVRELGYGMPRI